MDSYAESGTFHFRLGAERDERLELAQDPSGKPDRVLRLSVYRFHPSINGASSDHPYDPPGPFEPDKAPDKP